MQSLLVVKMDIDVWMMSRMSHCAPRGGTSRFHQPVTTLAWNF